MGERRMVKISDVWGPDGVKHSARALPIPARIPSGHDWCRCYCSICATERAFCDASLFELPPVVIPTAELVRRLRHYIPNPEQYLEEHLEAIRG